MLFRSHARGRRSMFDQHGRAADPPAASGRESHTSLNPIKAVIPPVPSPLEAGRKKQGETSGRHAAGIEVLAGRGSCPECRTSPAAARHSRPVERAKSDLQPRRSDFAPAAVAAQSRRPPAKSDTPPTSPASRPSPRARRGEGEEGRVGSPLMQRRRPSP